MHSTLKGILITDIDFSPRVHILERCILSQISFSFEYNFEANVTIIFIERFSIYESNIKNSLLLLKCKTQVIISILFKKEKIINE